MHDYIIVGGGSAGCVLANRLSAKSTNRVLLIEAGRDVRPAEEPAAILDMYPGRAAFDPANHWPDIKAHFQPLGHNAPPQPPTRHYEQARIMGGGSSINGQIANRGTPDDYDEWREQGATGWGWNDVLPFFRKLESDLDFSGPLHGTDGPITIHRIPRHKWPLFSNAVEVALAAAGFADIKDQNGRFEDGYFPMTLSNDGEHRMSSSRGYLTPAVRNRPNLQILADAEVTDLQIEDRVVKGVNVRVLGQTRLISGREIVLSTGAIRTPALLLSAGIGAARELRDLGIGPVVDLPGVGKNLQEHPGVSLSAFLRRSARLGNSTRRHIHLGLRYSSGDSALPSDMFMMFAAKSAWHPLGQRIGTVISWINKPYSRGFVSLSRNEEGTAPVATFNHLADRRDLDHLCDAVLRMAKFLAAPAMIGLIDSTSPSRYSGFAKALGRYNLRNYALTAPAALLLDVVPALRGEFFRRFIAGGLSLEALLADRTTLEDYVREHVFGQWHPCGTCRMGSGDDPGAVVDPGTGRVYGVAGLRVVDASLMPTAPRANLNLPVIMIAERMSDLMIRREH